MPAYTDVRQFDESQLSRSRVAELHGLAAQAAPRLAGTAAGIEITAFDATTGNASAVRSLDSRPVTGDRVTAALLHAYAIAPAFGLAATVREFAPDPAVQELSGGGSVVHLHQRYRGLPIFQAELTVVFSPAGAIAETVGSVIAVRGEAAGDCIPARDAVVRAAEHVSADLAAAPDIKDQFGEPLTLPALDVRGYAPTVVAAFPSSPEQPTVCTAGPFDQPVTASLLWFPVGDEVRLGWDVRLTPAPPAAGHRVIVSAQSGEVLYAVRLVHGLTGSALVYVPHGQADRTRRALPTDPADFDVPPPAAPPAAGAWLTGPRTEGDLAVARLAGSPSPVDGVERDGAVVFDADDPSGDDQKVINLFYYACALHDIFYSLGFQEADGNFQSDNQLRGGVGNDRVEAVVHPDPIPGTARFITPPDGGPPVMEMGPVRATGRHCALEATIVCHEFTHGVSSRLIGGALSTTALLSPQSEGIAEGLSDFIACALNDTVVVGAWVVDAPEGIRRHPYDEDFPDAFDKVGTGRHVSPHSIGEICAAMLMAVLRRIGKQAALQLVVDAMKVTAANPSFLNLRDALLSVAQDSPGLTDQLWPVFARFGLGPKAASNGAQLSGIVADFEPPAPEGE